MYDYDILKLRFGKAKAIHEIIYFTLALECMGNEKPLKCLNAVKFD
jgi:hypothetical protein